MLRLYNVERRQKWGEKRKEGRIGEEGSRERHKENDEHERVKRTHETKLFHKIQLSFLLLHLPIYRVGKIGKLG